MKRFKIFGALMMVGMLMMAGCTKEPSTSENGKDKPNKQVQSAQELSLEEVRDLLEELLPKAEETLSEIYRVEVDLNSVYEDELNGLFYEVTDPKYQSIEQMENKIREIFSEKAFYKSYKHLFSKAYPIFVEREGKLYAYELPFDAPPSVDWDFSKMEIGYQTENRIVVYASVGEADKLEGKIVLVKEQDVWKLDQNSNFDPGTIFNAEYMMAYDLLFSGREDVIEYISEEENWRMARPFEEYIVELDSNDTHIRSDYDPQEIIPYLGIDIYERKEGRLKLVDKLFVRLMNEKDILYPKQDRNGVVTLNYSKAVEKKSKDSIFGYMTENMIADEYVINWVESVENMRMKEEYFSREYVDQGELLFLVPKYYGTTIRLEEKTDGISEVIGWGEDEAFCFSKNVVGNVVIQYNGKEVSFEPIFDMESNLAHGDRFVIEAKG